MNDKNPNIRQLDYAIASLNEDAESMHSLITRSTDELERATAEGKKVADLAGETLNSLTALTEKLQTTIEDAKGMIAETNIAIEKLTTDFRQAQEEGKESFDSFTSTSLKASEKTRDDLQTDLLAHKTATAARMDSLEATITKRTDNLESTISRFGESSETMGKALDGRIEALQKKVTLPLYGAIVIAVLQLATLAALFLR